VHAALWLVMYMLHMHSVLEGVAAVGNRSRGTYKLCTAGMVPPLLQQFAAEAVSTAQHSVP
jgi:hypothetical protein